MNRTRCGLGLLGSLALLQSQCCGVCSILPILDQHAITGSLFALEVLHRTGMQFFEVATYAVCCGVVCLAVFRGLAHKTFGAVWIFKQSLLSVDWRHIVYGEAALLPGNTKLGCTCSCWAKINTQDAAG